MGVRAIIAIGVALAALCIAPVQAQPRVGLALSGGGARGLAHIGVLRALEELSIPVHAIAGTSMGAVVGALYASGRRPDEIARLIGEIEWEALLLDERDWKNRSLQDKLDSRDYFLGIELGFGGERAVTPAGVLAGQKLELLMRRIFGGASGFDALRIPFRAVATDINAAQPYVMSTGDLARAVRASMAIPGAFEPVEVDGRMLVDGGILNNLPVDVARDMGVDIVIAVDISSPLGEVGQASSLFSVTYQSVDTALIQNTIRSLATADLVIAPDLDQLGASDFDQLAAFEAAGYAAAQERARFLSVVSLDERDYAAWREALGAPSLESRQSVAFVEFSGNRRTSTRRLAALSDGLIGSEVAPPEIEAVVDRIYALQSFINVSYERVERNDGASGVRFNLREKTWGPDYLKFGLTIASDIDVDTEFSFRIGHRRRNVNALGAQWINDIELGNEFGLGSEFYQPLTFDERWFVAPYIEAREQSQNVFIDNRQLAEYEVATARGGVDFGYNTAATQLRLGVWRGFIDSDAQVGEGGFPIFDDSQGAVRLRIDHDSLDRPAFATHGNFGYIETNVFRRSLGAESDYLRVDFSGYRRFPWGEDSAWHLGASGSWLSDDDLPASAYVTLGGIDDLAGFPEDGLIGNRAVSLNAGLISGIQPLELPVIGSPRIVSLLHAGQVVDAGESLDIDDFAYGGSAGIAVDLLGAILFAGAGYTDGGDVRYYIRIGTGF